MTSQSRASQLRKLTNFIYLIQCKFPQIHTVHQIQRSLISRIRQISDFPSSSLRFSQSDPRFSKREKSKVILGTILELHNQLILVFDKYQTPELILLIQRRKSYYYDRFPGISPKNFDFQKLISSFEDKFATMELLSKYDLMTISRRYKNVVQE